MECMFCGDTERNCGAPCVRCAWVDRQIERFVRSSRGRQRVREALERVDVRITKGRADGTTFFGNPDEHREQGS